MVASAKASTRSPNVSAGANPRVRSDEPLTKNADDHPSFCTAQNINMNPISTSTTQVPP